MSLVQKIFRRTMRLVRSGLHHSSPDFSILLDLVSSVTVEELKYDVVPVLFNANDKRHGLVPPCYYTEVHEDEALSMGIFMLPDGQEIPLHDHPQMHGIIKVIYGRIRVTSYSLIHNIKLFEQRAEVAKRCSFKLFPGDEQFLLPVKAEGDTILTPSDPACFLTPVERNMHRVVAMDGGAAFFDILTPPYREPLRTCNYFIPLSLNKNQDMKCRDQKEPTKNDWLLQIAPPCSYYCELVPYTGERAIPKS